MGDKANNYFLIHVKIDELKRIPCDFNIFFLS